MKKEEFIRQLEYLLQDIQEDDIWRRPVRRERQRFWKDSEARNGLLR